MRTRRPWTPLCVDRLTSRQPLRPNASAGPATPLLTVNDAAVRLDASEKSIHPPSTALPTRGGL
jgi:hypothetical protein